MNEHIVDKVFEKIDFSQQKLPKGEYEHCRFINCQFNGCNLSHYRFIDCEFENCEMSLVVFDQTALQNVKFKTTKLTGVSFEKCNPFLLTLKFDQCKLNLASLANLNIPGTHFLSCDMVEINLTGTYLRDAIFDNCDLDHAIFYKTDLTNADLRTAYNYIIDPENNRLKNARFSFPACKGLLTKYDVCIEN